MANYSTLKAAVADVVKTNGNQTITGANLQSVLLSIINSVGGGGYIFKGVATPSTSAGTPDENVFYIGGAGTYANFGTSVTVPVGSICVFKYNGSWTKEQIALFAGIDDVPTAGSNNLVKSGGVYEQLTETAKLKQISIYSSAPNTTTTYYPLTNKIRIGHKYALIVNSNASATGVDIWEAEMSASSYRGTLIAESAAINVGENIFFWTSTRDNCEYINIFSNTLQSANVTLTVYLMDEFYLQNSCVGKRNIDVEDMDEKPIGGSDNLVLSGGISNSITEHGGSKFDALYILRKTTSSSTTTDDANGTRIRIIITISDGCNLFVSSQYDICANLYNGLTSAILAASSYKEEISGSEYTKEITGATTTGGWLSISMKKEDGSVITDAEKEQMINDILIKIYAKNTFAEIIDNDLNQQKKHIDTISGSLKTAGLSDIIISVTAEDNAKIYSVQTISSGAKFLGKNLLDADSFVKQKIINDSGNEVSDVGSSYYGRMIPCHGQVIISSFVMQRIYLYNANGTFLRRETASNDRTEYVVPSDVYFVKVQVQSTTPISNGIVTFQGNDISYEPFYYGTNAPENGAFYVYMDDGSEASINISAYCKAIIPSVGIYDYWEPTSVTDNYKCTHLGQDTQSIPSLNTLGYLGFISTYFDTYIGKYADGYEVKKYELGQDAGAVVEHKANPLFSYEFSPRYYNKTILLSAGMNTCEASTYFGIAYFIKELMEHTEDGMEALYNSTRIIVIPVICPTGISHDPLLYRSANDVRINKNFSYLNSWQYNYDRGGQYPGEYPDSEVETKMLKYWFNKYNGADFYMDCHSDTGGSDGQTLALSNCFCSDNSVISKLRARKNEIADYYRNKGYIPTGQNPTFIYSLAGQAYPKQPYTMEVCGIPSIMHEQYIDSTAYGSDGHTNNDSYGIKNYVALIRWYCLIMAQGGIKIIQ